jgi:hypothetical protein
MNYLEINQIYNTIFLEITAKLNLNISCSADLYHKHGINHQYLDKTLTDAPIDSKHILVNGIDFFKRHYTPIKPDGTATQLAISPKFSHEIWDYADSVLKDDAQKNLFFNFLKSCHHGYNFRKIITNETDERFFKFLNSSIPEDSTKCLKENFDPIFPLLKRRSFETAEQKDILFRFSKNYKRIIRRPDLKPIFCDLIAQKIPVNEHAPFAKIAGRNIILGDITTPDDIMSKPSPALSLSLKKDKLFERIKITKIHIPSVPIMNNIHEKLVIAFNSKNIKERLGLVDTHFVEFMAAHNRGK